MSVYQPLQSFLARQAEASVVMSYDDIERVLGRKLPKTAYGANKRQWWANTETHSQALAWLRANRKAKLDVTRSEVAFIRQTQAGSTRVSEDDAEFALPGLLPAARRLLDDVAEEKGVTLAVAAAHLLNGLAHQRRTATLAWFEGKSKFSNVSSADLIREDRDAR